MTSPTTTALYLPVPTAARSRRVVLAIAVGLAVAVGGLTITTGSVAAAPPAPATAGAPAVPASIARQATGALAVIGTSAFAGSLDSLATSVANQLGIDPARMRTAWQSADVEHQTALLAALGQLGVPYRRNTSKPGVSFDCSGLTSYAWAQAGYSLPRQSAAQIRRAAKRTKATAQAGDLVYYPGHIMIWLGVDAAIIHSPYTGRNVEVGFVAKRRVNSVKYGDPTG